MLPSRFLRSATRSSIPISRRQPYICTQCRHYASKPSTTTANPKPSEQTTTTTTEPPDHRKLGRQQSLFLNSDYSPGSPIFLPHGTKIFTRLVDFLRAQYTRYGFEEVITPTIYKKGLWARSGHLENYAEDMFSVRGNKKATSGVHSSCGHDHEAEAMVEEEGEGEDGEFGLKPMNCPGHCLIFASQPRSYRDLPIRYADFSPLHRNEISGALSGLTRVRRFHQDDGHIFCRPSQVEEEIKSTLDFVKTVYSVLQLGVDYRLALSTRPLEHYMGTDEEWARAEGALKKALDASGLPWSINEGDGAFYGPKIDIVVKDSDGKEHQTATIQLDFQLPKRFDLQYQAPAPELEKKGETTEDKTLLAEYGPVQPVMIHRAVLGSVERLMALLIERYNGSYPFWLNPRQILLLTINDTAPVLAYAQKVRNILIGREDALYDTLKSGEPFPAERAIAQPTGLVVDVDSRAEKLSKKKAEAKARGYGEVIVIGPRDVDAGRIGQMGESFTPEEVRDRFVAAARRFQ